ncbi:YqgE/AlgH family protein [Sulfitobacter sp. F26169L]|uniref:YqgE/AlgH family protein n=1 Tax=Sulfitobacter sp. F26169L TaxID=2996015 RepID=UPI002260E7EB|nr:YqgE/AlgH family protein [Sulfitobacter sp. F26169L]MCX7566917.1 YqgE/AlgH family protein [Sulfitobacter sp. F26169L]
MNLAGQLLIAMPGMSDPRFSRSVIFICAHSGEGAMGLIVNKRAGDMTLREIFSRLEIETKGGPLAKPVHIGGPVETERGFVLHRDKSRLAPDALVIPDGYVLTSTQDILADIGADKGPDPFLFTLGYSGWGPGQLEHEITQNGWLTAPASPELVFDTAHAQVWDAALRSIGIDPVSLSGAAGRA